MDRDIGVDGYFPTPDKGKPPILLAGVEPAQASILWDIGVGSYQLLALGDLVDK